MIFRKFIIFKGYVFSLLMENSFKKKLLYHLLRRGENTKHDITDIMLNEFGDKNNIASFLYSIEADGYIKKYITTGMDGWGERKQNEEYKIEAEIIKDGVEHLLTLENSLKSTISLCVSFAAILFTGLTYLKDCTPSHTPDKSTQLLKQKEQKVVPNHAMSKTSGAISNKSQPIPINSK